MAHAEQCVRVHGDVGPGERAEPDVGDHRRSAPVVVREKVGLRVQHRALVQPLRHDARHPSLIPPHPSSRIARDPVLCRTWCGASGERRSSMSQPVPACTQQPSRAPRRRSEEAVQVLSFVPSRAARGLITGESRNLAVIVPDITNPHFAVVVRPVERSARQRDLQVLPGRPGEARAGLFCVDDEGPDSVEPLGLACRAVLWSKHRVSVQSGQASASSSTTLSATPSGERPSVSMVAVATWR